MVLVENGIMDSNANVPVQQERSESYPTVGGDGEYSYARNSSRQRAMAQRGKDILVSTIGKNLDLKSQSTSVTFRIADLCCSIGPNTFESTKIIIEAIQDKYEAQKQEHETTKIPELEFLVFFNDHFASDFNALFNNLPADRQYFATGIPGSFHGRLFPKDSLDFMYSSNSLQWLSRAPKELSDPNSPAYNRDRIFYVDAPPAVCHVYSAQFNKDMDSFLNAGCQELVPGGLMVLLVPGRENGSTARSHNSSVGRVFMPLETILLEMAKEGLVSEKQMEMFNLPMYFPSPEELTVNIQRNPGLEILEFVSIVNRKFFPVLSKGELRTGFEGLLSKYFGIEIVEELFDRYEKSISVRLHDTIEYSGVGIFVALRRKV